MIDQFCHSFIQMADVSADEFLSATVCFGALSNRQIWATQQGAILNLLTGKDVSVSQPTASGKFVIFEYFPIFFGVVYGCNRWLSIFSSGTYRKKLRLRPLMKSIASSMIFHLLLVENKRLIDLSFDITETYKLQIYVKNIQFNFGP